MWPAGLALVFAVSGCAGSGNLALYAPPSLLPHTTSAMKTPGFWISRHPGPDAVILSPEDILRFNQKIRGELKLAKDLSAWPAALSGEELRATLQKTLEDLRSREWVFLSGLKPSAAYWSSMEDALNRDAIPAEVPRQYGLVTRYASQRFLPVEEGLYAQAHDEDFDELQNSALDIGTPVVILHRSLDGKWLWVESPISRGWVEAENVAAAADEQLQPFWSAPFVVVAGPKADIYFDTAMTDWGGSVRMGARLPLTRLEGGHAEMTVPRRRPDGSAALVSGFAAAEDVHEGYLPYTPRQILRQAFKMLHQPYGWGGMYGGQDCSRFMQEVFTTVGIDLPRDSGNQIQVGQGLADWSTAVPDADKLRVLAQAPGGITILGMKGHILLYLGTIDGRAYAIHSVWAYRRPAPGGRDDVFVLNRVVVSDLNLGEGSKRGSLLDRLNAAKILK